MALQTPDGYYAYGTGGPEGQARLNSKREFPILHSRDLSSWNFLSGALELDSADTRHYWAPEVAENHGNFFLYYSAGGPEGENHQIRVAIAQHPAGPFKGDDRPLIREEPFTIDAHPFCDPIDGTWYLFFAKDFFEDPTGTGIAVVRLNDDMKFVEGPITELLRGSAEWHTFERDRDWYNRTWPTWYCVEGPFVVYRHKRYWMFYSGGNWHADNYGVGCAVADRVTGPYLDPNAPKGPSVLTTGRGLYGPGHCSVVIGPDGEDRICFHAWDADYTARRMHIARLRWTAEGPVAEI